MCGAWFCLVWLAPLLAAAEPKAIQLRKTPDGVSYGVQGEKPVAPAPTLFVIATNISDTLTSREFNRVGMLLTEQGVIAVAVDNPCHGQDQRPGEAGGLSGWRERLNQGEDFVADHARQLSSVLDHLIAEGYTDKARVAVCGTSRGGFMALHCAAAEPRFVAVAAFAPVTDLLRLREFDGMEKHAGTNALSAIHKADKLAGRSIWVCIGNHDERVGTDDCIAFTRATVKASIDRKLPADSELHVMPSPGHTIHTTAHEEAAQWFAKKLGLKQ